MDGGNTFCSLFSLPHSSFQRKKEKRKKKKENDKNSFRSFSTVVDQDGDGVIGFLELLSTLSDMEVKEKKPSSFSFRIMDRKNEGRVSHEDLVVYLEGLDPSHTSEARNALRARAQEMIRHFGVEGGLTEESVQKMYDAGVLEDQIPFPHPAQPIG
jgi:Ca2+-binding EF-hand superfamily protein